MSEFVELRSVSKIYRMGEVKITAVDRMSFTISKGQFVVIVGPSGAGKTTVLNILGGMDSASSGHIFVDGEDRATAILSAEGDWSMYTLSNHMVLRGMSAGKHEVCIRLNPEGLGYDNNMSFNRDNLNDWIVRQLNVAKIR